MIEISWNCYRISSSWDRDLLWRVTWQTSWLWGFSKEARYVKWSNHTINYFAARGNSNNKPAANVNKNNNQGNQKRSRVVSQFREKPSHRNKKFFKIKNNKQTLPSANYAFNKDSTWLLDSWSAHLMTSYLNKIKLHSKYEA